MLHVFNILLIFLKVCCYVKELYTIITDLIKKDNHFCQEEHYGINLRGKAVGSQFCDYVKDKSDMSH